MSPKGTVKLADTVAYTTRKGFAKAAIVVGTPASITTGEEYGSSIQPLETGEVYLRVLSPRSARDYVRKASFDAETGTWKGVYPAPYVHPDFDADLPGTDQEALNEE
jgi:hypothetical protein